MFSSLRNVTRRAGCRAASGARQFASSSSRRAPGLVVSWAPSQSVRVRLMARNVALLGATLGTAHVFFSDQTFAGIAAPSPVQAEALHSDKCKTKKKKGSKCCNNDNGNKKDNNSSSFLASADGEPRDVVLALDGSEYSMFALRWALAHMVKQGDNVTIVHVMDYVPVFSPVTMHEPDPKMEEHCRRVAVQTLNRLASVADEFGVEPELRLLNGPIKTTLVDWVNRSPPDVLVLSSRGLGSVSRAILGSVSDYVVSAAQCPVMVVKQPIVETVQAAGSDGTASHRGRPAIVEYETSLQ